MEEYSRGSWKLIHESSRIFLDSLILQRWVVTLVFAVIYMLRIYFVQGFYVTTYCLGIHIVESLEGFLSPLVELDLEVSDGPMVSNKGFDDEFKPFIRSLPEFKFWLSITTSICIAFAVTFFPAFNLLAAGPGWQILPLCWIVLFVLTMKRRIAHMIKYKYIPFSIGQQNSQGSSSPNQGFKGRVLECYCGIPAHEKVSKTTNHRKRKFYGCQKFKCGFIMWADDYQFKKLWIKGAVIKDEVVNTETQGIKEKRSSNAAGTNCGGDDNMHSSVICHLCKFCFLLLFSPIYRALCDRVSCYFEWI